MNSFLLPLACALALQDEPAKRPDPAEGRGLIVKTGAFSPGYTLLAPLHSTSTYLVDSDGKTVHEWKSDAPPGNGVHLLENGNLLRTERVASETFFGGGQGGRVRELDRDGKVVWELPWSDERRCQHHDAKKLANGHVMLISWERKSRDEALAAGRDPKLATGDFWPDALFEIDPATGRIAWEWHAWDHLVQDVDPAKPNHGDPSARVERIDVNADRSLASATPRGAERERLRGIGYLGDDDDRPAGDDGPPRSKREGDWLHTNAFDVDDELGLVVISVHTLSEVWVIDHTTTSAEAAGSSGGRHGKGGDLLFRFGHPKVHGGRGEQTLFHQHDVEWLGGGRVLLFNNGGRGTRDFSSVDEWVVPLDSERRIAPGASATLAWTWTSPDIFSSHISGAQRLSNGNTLVCSGENGRIVEVTPAGAVVWRLDNVLGGDAPMFGPRGPRGGRRGERTGGSPDGREAEADVPEDGRRRRGGDGAHGRRGAGEHDDLPPRDGRGMPSRFSLFRAPRYASDHPGVAKLLPPSSTATHERRE